MIILFLKRERISMFEKEIGSEGTLLQESLKLGAQTEH